MEAAHTPPPSCPSPRRLCQSRPRKSPPRFRLKPHLPRLRPQSRRFQSTRPRFPRYQRLLPPFPFLRCQSLTPMPTRPHLLPSAPVPQLPALVAQVAPAPRCHSRVPRTRPMPHQASAWLVSLVWLLSSCKQLFDRAFLPGVSIKPITDDRRRMALGSGRCLIGGGVIGRKFLRRI